MIHDGVNLVEVTNSPLIKPKMSAIGAEPAVRAVGAHSRTASSQRKQKCNPVIRRHETLGLPTQIDQRKRSRRSKMKRSKANAVHFYAGDRRHRLEQPTLGRGRLENETIRKKFWDTSATKWIDSSARS